MSYALFLRFLEVMMIITTTMTPTVRTRTRITAMETTVLMGMTCLWKQCPSDFIGPEGNTNTHSHTYYTHKHHLPTYTPITQTITTTVHSKHPHDKPTQK